MQFENYSCFDKCIMLQSFRTPQFYEIIIFKKLNKFVNN